LNRNTLCLLLGVALLWLGWRLGTEATSDLAVLRVSDVDHTDRYVTLWAVDDGSAVWLRAARPDRKWLDWLRKRPNVTLDRNNGDSRRYVAEIVLRPDLRERVDELMREKYGWADQARELLLGTDTIAVRLEPVE
jgi:hypothetical protein